MTITKTCRTCGGDNVSGLRPTGPVPDVERQTTALSKALEQTEEQADRALCRVRELEQVIRAFCSGAVKADVLRKVIGAEAY